MPKLPVIHTPPPYVDSPNPLDGASADIRNEYEEMQALFEMQAPMVQHFLEAQARQIADAIVKKQSQLHFMLPDKIVIRNDAHGKPVSAAIPTELREQLLGGVISRLTGEDIRKALRQRLIELEGSNIEAVSTCACLIRHAAAVYMVHSLLPTGRRVTYVAPEGEEIPAQPAEDDQSRESAITAATDAIAEEGQEDEKRGELVVPYVPAARRFYLPQWVAFDEQSHLLVNSINEAEAHIASMQQFLFILHTAVSLAAYLVADPEYQQKRYGMLGQLVNQGRAFARFETEEMIRIIKHRAAAQDLNRGLSLSLPYFDDQALELRTHDFEVIPAGRILFVPAFVVRAVREEYAKVAQDTRLSPSTRKYLLAELSIFEEAFEHLVKTPKTHQGSR
ncbi:MAG: hypothetical protein M1281_08030 [Chloroflexi bacterium]|nr:hypothetical protein [Chloroflexota bacterium]